MKTFKIVCKTNHYQAQTNPLFAKHSTEATIAQDLAAEDAKDRLIECFNEDYQFSTFCENQAELLADNPKVIEQAGAIGMTAIDYANSHLNILLAAFGITGKSNYRTAYTFDGAGYYQDGFLKMRHDADSYEHDGYYYSIVEEISEPEMQTK